MFLGFYATWSPRPFDELSEPRPAPIRRPLGLRPAQWLGMIGAALLLVGVFVPAFGVRAPGESLLEVSAQDDGVPWDALVVMVLALGSLVLAWKDHCLFLWLTGIGAQIALASSYALWRPQPLSWNGGNLICGLTPNYGLRTGWWLMELGLLLLLLAAFLAELPPLRHWKPMPPTCDARPFPLSEPSRRA